MAFRKNTAAAAPAAAEERVDIYQRITDQIVAAIEAGAGKWEMPWNAKSSTGGAALALPRNVVSGNAYRGINVLALWCAAQSKGYGSNIWGTYKQWLEKGAQVRKGEKATAVVLWKQYDREVEGGNEGDTETRSFARAFSVFNAAQVDGYEAPAAAPVLAPAVVEAARIEAADEFFRLLGINLSHGGNKAFYQPATDRVQMPEFSAFRDPAAYYGTLAHEAVHWVGHASRCDRNLTGRFGSEAYAAEELVAELGAAFLSADLGISSEPRPDHAAYVQSWLKVLKGDKRAIFTAAAQAQKAADWMHAAVEAAEGKREAA